MKRVKLLSAVMATGLMAAQLAMPVMAAEGGSVNVAVGMKTGLIRVEVPTMIEVSIDQFEQGGKSQIYSEEFTMLNKSPMPVRVDVTSTVAQGTGGSLAELVNTKAEAETSAAANGAIWMAVAAATDKTDGAYSYDDLATTTEEAVADLAESNNNVAAFDKGTMKAKQSFYLQKGDDELQWAYVADSQAATINTGSGYEVTTVDTSGANMGSGKAGAFTTALASNAYVEIKTADNSISRMWEKGTVVSSDVTLTSGCELYKVADTVSAFDHSSQKAYLYQESKNVATEGGEAAFSYIGKLSAAADKEWASGSSGDLNTVKIEYTFTGAGETLYASVEPDCTFGLYTAPTAPDIANTTQVAKKGQASKFAVSLGAGSKGASGVASVAYGDMELISAGFVTFENGELVLSAEAVDFLFENGLLSTTDAKLTVELAVTLTMNDDAAEAYTTNLILKGK